MKLRRVIFISLLIVSTFSYAQSDAVSQKKEQLKSLKVAFITEQLALSTTEAQKFWPIYNTYDREQFAVRQQKIRALHKQMNSGQINSMTDQEAEAFLVKLQAAEDELHQLRKQLNINLRKVMSPLKIIKLSKAEDDFNRKLLRQYRNKQKK